MEQYRQGDVLLVRVAALPAGATPRQARNGNHILQEGEATGHCHYVAERDADVLDISVTRRMAEELGIADPRAIAGGLRVRSVTTLWHGTPTSAPAGPADADHDPITLAVGEYLVIRPREYSDEEELRLIAD
jgi:hypothetical protein